MTIKIKKQSLMIKLQKTENFKGIKKNSHTWWGDHANVSSWIVNEQYFSILF
jgi:hypothetical protein